MCIWLVSAVLLSWVNIQSNTHTGVRIVSTNHSSRCAYCTCTYTLDKLFKMERLHVVFHCMSAMQILLAIFQYNKPFCDTLGHLLNYRRGSFQCVCQSQNYYITAHNYQFAEANSNWQGPIPATPPTTIHVNTHTGWY